MSSDISGDKMTERRMKRSSIFSFSVQTTEKQKETGCTQALCKFHPTPILWSGQGDAVFGVNQFCQMFL